MEYFRKTKDRLMQAAGLGASIPEDAELQASQQRLKLLYTTVQSMHKSMSQYARSMCMVGEAARSLSDDISKFYAKSTPHQKMVGVFIDASLDQESNALLLFKEQFNDDIDHHFDEWLTEIRLANDNLKSLYDLHNDIHNLKYKLEHGSKTPSTYQSDHSAQLGQEGIRADMTFCANIEKQFVTDKAAFIASVNTMLSTRYERFDVVFIRLMEFQKDFFADGLDVTEHYEPIVQTYRQNNKIVGSSSTNTTSSTTPKSPTPTESKPIPKQQQQQPQRPESTPQQTQQSKSTPQQQPAATEKPKQPPSQPPSQPQQQEQPKPTPEPTKQKEVNLFDLDFSSNTPPNKQQSQPSQSSTPQQSSTAAFDLFNFDGPSPNKSTPQSSQPSPTPSNKSQTQDLFGDIFSATPQQQPKTQQSSADLGDFFSSGSQPTTPRPQNNTTSSNLDFDSFLSSNKKSSSGGVDDIDDDTSKPQPKAQNNDLYGFNSGSSSSNVFSKKSNDFDNFDPLGPSTSSSTTKQAPKETFEGHPEHNGPQLTEKEEQEQIHNHKQGLEQRIEQWRYKHGQERDIQGLLSTLQNVLWVGHTWKKVDSTSLLDYNSIKKVFRRALLFIHPDKVSTGTPEMKATADLVFEILNNAFKRYEVQQGLRSA